MIGLLRRGSTGLLYFKKGEDWIEVEIKQCFPHSEKENWLSLCDSNGKEIFLIEKFDDLHLEDQVIIRELLFEMNFRLNIQSILHIDEEVELRTFDVVTDRGARKFQMRSEDWPVMIDKKLVVLEDLHGDTYLIDDFHQLDAKSQALLYPLLD